MTQLIEKRSRLEYYRINLFEKKSYSERVSKEKLEKKVFFLDFDLYNLENLEEIDFFFKESFEQRLERAIFNQFESNIEQGQIFENEYMGEVDQNEINLTNTQSQKDDNICSNETIEPLKKKSKLEVIQPNKSNNPIFFEIDDISLMRSDVTTLIGENWLNDNCIIAFMKLFKTIKNVLVLDAFKTEKFLSNKHINESEIFPKVILFNFF